MKYILRIAILFAFIPNAQAGKNIPYHPKVHVYIKGKWDFVNETTKKYRNNNGKIGKCYIIRKFLATSTNPNPSYQLNGTARFSSNTKGIMKINLLFTDHSNNQTNSYTHHIKVTYKFKVFKRGDKTYLKTREGKDISTHLLTFIKKKTKIRLTIKTISKSTCTFNGLQLPCFEIFTQTYER